jgi:hypothetical protein
MKKLKPLTVDWAQIERFLASADRKLVSAHKILAFDFVSHLEAEEALQSARSFIDVIRADIASRRP